MKNKRITFLILAVLLIGSSYIMYAASVGTLDLYSAPAPIRSVLSFLRILHPAKFTVLDDEQIDEMVNSIILLRNPNSKLTISHLGHPGYERLAFIYDKAIDALVLKATGHQAEAEEVIDYFADKLKIPIEDLYAKRDSNNICGAIHLIKDRKRRGRWLKSFTNSVNVDSKKPYGESILEFYTTPGPTSFLIYAMLIVNGEKYLDEAKMLGEVLLSMQDPGGGIRDGNRAPKKVHTEPHVDGCAAFLMLYKATGEQKWLVSARRGYSWFRNNVFMPDLGIVHQGKWEEGESTIFAEDCYSWTLAGPVGDMMSLDQLRQVTKRMLTKSLVRVTLDLPGKGKTTVTLVDFTDPKDERAKIVRGGFHPMGSVEWTGGAILALQKNAVRAWKAGRKEISRFYKALAETLFAETLKCFYPLKDSKCRMTFYATGQDVEVGPFGSARRDSAAGWRTPYFNAVSTKGKVLVHGGSPVGNWILLPYMGVNPFIIDDDYKKTYDSIIVGEYYVKTAKEFIDKAAEERTFVETIPGEIPDPATQIIEPRIYNGQIWKALTAAFSAEKHQDPVKAKACYRQAMAWAEKTLSDPVWYRKAKEENDRKQKEFGGLIYYPWGMVCANNDHPYHTAIMRYSLLNEIAVSMWAMVRCNYELGNISEAKYWIRKIIEDVPLHQVAVNTRQEGAPIIGYWNAIISWEDNPGNIALDEKIGSIYRQTLKENHYRHTRPAVMRYSDSDVKRRLEF